MKWKKLPVLVLGRASEMPKYSGPYLLWEEKTRISYSSETTAIAPSGMLNRVCVSEQQ